ncbi:YggS family pyridoxal phosphate-dependent enzyme [Cognatilysobacter bugurensis]|uniref:Pyridoxal phosphate homeostasis protein n=1 Tax=Cognatilysobacter bugurensis TaxID=543356 RepID=A0A918W6D6_9GAMM|nr:YggS family pyridoxal phosphate-dependent enzyme [Lysobacter bugurensis]GHA77555.1 YggS family pyridoxal phosphate enzyme [Lysobacter bugurensis]
MTTALDEVLDRLDTAARQARQPQPRLLAVSKFQPATAIAQLAALGQRAFGENYVQEAAGKRAELTRLDLEWHLIGHLQTNKAREAAMLFDWVQTVDRPRIVDALGRHRPNDLPPLQVLIQVNVDDEASKHGCAPEDVEALAARIHGHERLVLRGLMAIPTPHPDPEQRRPAFARMHGLFDALRGHHPAVDTLSMGMSDDCAVAISEGATMVRIGTALFGARPPRPADRA